MITWSTVCAQKKVAVVMVLTEVVSLSSFLKPLFSHL